MGQFEEKTAATRKKTLPDDVPKAEIAANQHPDGAVYRANDGTRYVLRHERKVPAKWVPVRARKAKDNGGKKTK